MADKRWKDRFIIDAYELAKQGYNGMKISKALGVPYATFASWKQNKRLFYVALAMGKKYFKKNESGDFGDYVYDKLPENLKRHWRKINELKKCRSSYTTIQKFLEGKGTLVSQYLFLYAWTRSGFSVSQALKKLCIPKTTFDEWKQDDMFRKLVDEIEWHKKNFFEDHLAKLVKDGDSAATIFANKTYNKDRGYGDSKQLDINIKGQINHNYIQVKDLDLPLDTKKEILQSIRKLNQERYALEKPQQNRHIPPLQSTGRETVAEFLPNER